MTEVIEGFLWVSNFQLQDFVGRKIFYFWGGLINGGIFGVFKTIWRFVVVSAYPGRVVLPFKYNKSFFAFCELLRLGNLTWDFLEPNFWFRDFFGFCWKPPFNHPQSLEIQGTTPLGGAKVKKTENWKGLERITNVSLPFFSVFPVFGFHYFWSALHCLTAAWNSLF